MQNITALVLDPDTCLQRDLVTAQIQHITLCPSASAEQLSNSMMTGPADLILLDMELPGISGLELVAELRKQKPGIPVILLSSKAPTEQDWISAAAEPLVELMQAPITSGKLQYHLSRLFEKKEPIENPESYRVTSKPVNELRNDSGRLDAKLIVKVFDLSMTDIEGNVSISRQALSKTPDSLSVQSALRDFERIAQSLLVVTGSIKGLKMWLHSSNERFEGHTPIEVIKLGKVKLLADWVDDARLGSPG
ncbi:hypothetical protein BH11CYA1_BH11CYA1_44030 [soil metagenome]